MSSWACCGSLSRLWTDFGLLWTFGMPFGSLRGCPWPSFGRPWPPPGRHLGPMWVPLALPWGAFGHHGLNGHLGLNLDSLRGPNVNILIDVRSGIIG